MKKRCSLFLVVLSLTMPIFAAPRDRGESREITIKEKVIKFVKRFAPRISVLEDYPTPPRP